MQAVADDAFAMIRKPQINILTHPVVEAAWESYRSQFGKRQGSQLGMAALLMFLNAKESERNRWIAEVAQAETLGGFERLTPTPAHPSPTPAPQGEPSPPVRVGPSPASKRLGPSAAGKRIK